MYHPSPTRPGRGLGIGERVRAWRSASVSRAGFTLVETMLVIALIVAVSAITLPIMASFAEASAFRNTCEQVSASGMFTRAEAERSGQAVELRLERRRGEWLLVATPLAVATGDDSQFPGDEGVSNRGAVGSGGGETSARAGEDVLMRLTRLWTVASRERVSRGLAEPGLSSDGPIDEDVAFDEVGDAGRGAMDEGAAEVDATEDPDWDLVGASDADGEALSESVVSSGVGNTASESVLLAIYWPGGTIVAGPSEVRIGDGRGRRASVRANGWSGVLIVELIAAAMASGTRGRDEAAADKSDSDAADAEDVRGSKEAATPRPTGAKALGSGEASASRLPDGSKPVGADGDGAAADDDENEAVPPSREEAP